MNLRLSNWISRQKEEKKNKLERVHTDCHRIRYIKGCWGRDSIIVAVVLLARQSDECAQPLRNLNQQQNRPNHNACWLDVCARLYDVCEYPVFVSKESHCCTSGEELQHQQQFLKYHQTGRIYADDAHRHVFSSFFAQRLSSRLSSQWKTAIFLQPQLLWILFEYIYLSQQRLSSSQQ